MNSPQTRTADPQSDSPEDSGSHDAWDRIWSSQEHSQSQRRVLFTRQQPATIYQFWQRCYADDLIALLGPRLGGRQLELGCGRGTTSLYLACAGARDLTLVDLSPAGLEAAAKTFADEGFDRPQLVHADVRDTGLPASSYDCIYNIGLLEHFHDPGPVLREAARLLKPGGLIFMPIVPTLPLSKRLLAAALFHPWRFAKLLLKSLLGRQPRPTEDADGMTRTDHDRASYRRSATDAGLSEVRCLPYNPYWKVNEDHSRLGGPLSLAAYKLHYRCTRALRAAPVLRTAPAFECCYLLTGTRSLES